MGMIASRISLIIILLMLIIPLITLNSAAKYMSDSETVHEDEYWTVWISLSDSESHYSIDIEWDSNYMIDVYLVDSDEYERYKNGQTFTTFYKSSGTGGVIDKDLYSPYDSPYYIIFDNTDQGDAQPAWDMVDNIATVSYSGTVDSGSEKTSEAVASGIAIFALIGIVVVIAVIIIIVVLAYYYKKGYREGATQYRCPTCNYPARFVNQNNKWYCDTCRNYISNDQATQYPAARPVNPQYPPK